MKRFHLYNLNKSVKNKTNNMFENVNIIFYNAILQLSVIFLKVNSSKIILCYGLINLHVIFIVSVTY